MTELREPGNSTRKAVIYRIAPPHPRQGQWRIRFERYPEHVEAASGWFGGRILWDHDQLTELAALEIAERWVKEGRLPDGTMDAGMKEDAAEVNNCACFCYEQDPEAAALFGYTGIGVCTCSHVDDEHDESGNCRAEAADE